MTSPASAAVARKLCAVTVDLDEIPSYLGIHGLEEVAGLARGAVYGEAIGRLGTFAEGLGAPMTWFVVGHELGRPGVVEQLKGCLARGDEIASHTLDHRYDLLRLSPEQRQRQVFEGKERLVSALGVEPKGFRAPGYLVDDALLELVSRAGHQWDSSVFPCPAYWAAKVAVMGGQRLAKRSSRAIVGSPTALMAPRTPYRIGAHYWRRGRGLLEIPVQVTPGLRMPFIGTSLGVGGPAVARRLARSLASESTVNLELHGLDALDRFDGLEPLAAVQPDLRVPWSRKLASIGAALWTLKDAGFEFVTLSELAAQFPPAPAADS